MDDVAFNVGNKYEGKDINGNWRLITLTSENADSTFQAVVHDGFNTLWRNVHSLNLRRQHETHGLLPTPKDGGKGGRQRDRRNHFRDTEGYDGYISPSPFFGYQCNLDKATQPNGSMPQRNARVPAPSAYPPHSAPNPMQSPLYGVANDYVPEPAAAPPAPSAANAPKRDNRPQHRKSQANYPHRQSPQNFYPQSPQNLYAQGQSLHNFYPQDQSPQNLYPQGQSPQNLYPEGQSPKNLYPQGQSPKNLYAQGQSPKNLYPQGQSPQNLYPQDQSPQNLYPQDQSPQNLYPQGQSLYMNSFQANQSPTQQMGSYPMTPTRVISMAQPMGFPQSPMQQTYTFAVQSTVMNPLYPGGCVPPYQMTIPGNPNCQGEAPKPTVQQDEVSLSALGDTAGFDDEPEPEGYMTEPPSPRYIPSSQEQLFVPVVYGIRRPDAYISAQSMRSEQVYRSSCSAHGSVDGSESARNLHPVDDGKFVIGRPPLPKAVSAQSDTTTFSANDGQDSPLLRKKEFAQESPYKGVQRKMSGYGKTTADMWYSKQSNPRKLDDQAEKKIWQPVERKQPSQEFLDGCDSVPTPQGSTPRGDFHDEPALDDPAPSNVQKPTVRMARLLMETYHSNPKNVILTWQKLDSKDRRKSLEDLVQRGTAVNAEEGKAVLSVLCALLKHGVKKQWIQQLYRIVNDAQGPRRRSICKKIQRLLDEFW